MAQDPFGLRFVNANPNRIIVLDRVVAGAQPEYCVHGRTRCLRCMAWCWLGDKTHDVVSAGTASPVCLDCARTLSSAQPRLVDRFEDRLRSEGPH